MTTNAMIDATRDHAKLVSQLEALNGDHVAAEVNRIHSLVIDLEKDVQMGKEQLVELTNRNQIARRKLDFRATSKGSKGQTLVYPLIGEKKFQEKARAIEEALIKMFREELSAKEELEQSERRLAELQLSLSSLQQDAEKAESVWKQLDELYDNVFDGCIEHPEEKTWKERLESASTNLTNLTSQIQWELSVLQSLEVAEAKIKKLEAHLLVSVPWFKPGGHQNFSSQDTQRKRMMEQANKLFGEARDVLSRVHLSQLLSPIKLPDYQPSHPSFQTMSARSQVHAHLLSAKEATVPVLERLRAQSFSVKQWVKTLRDAAEEAEKEEKEMRANLRVVRRSIFEQVVSRGPDTPPGYQS